MKIHCLCLSEITQFDECDKVLFCDNCGRMFWTPTDYCAKCNVVGGGCEHKSEPETCKRCGGDIVYEQIDVDEYHIYCQCGVRW